MISELDGDSGRLLPIEALVAPMRRAHKLTAVTLDNFARVHLNAADRFRELNLRRIDALHSSAEPAQYMETQSSVVAAYAETYTDYLADLFTTASRAQTAYLNLVADWAKSPQPTTSA